jgi:hypothetical protein
MGYETKCRVQVDDGSVSTNADATVLLETDELIVRGDARVIGIAARHSERDPTRRRPLR